MSQAIDETVFRAFDAEGKETARIDPVREFTLNQDGTITVDNGFHSYDVRVPDGGSWKVVTLEEMIREKAQGEVVDFFEKFGWLTGECSDAREHFGLSRGEGTGLSGTEGAALAAWRSGLETP